ncbi:MAG: hypothetical protein WCY29_00485 [Novosphingobium sp.]
MAEIIGMTSGNVERFPGAFPPSPVSDELHRIMALLRGACPAEATVSFSFDGRLQAHIDVRKREDVLFVEAVLPTLEADLFHGVSIGSTPGHPFHHRISAAVRA